MSNVVSVDGREPIVASPWRQLCSSLLHNLDVKNHSSDNACNINEMQQAGALL